MGCDLGQGFLFAQPMAEDRFLTMLCQRRIKYASARRGKNRSLRSPASVGLSFCRYSSNAAASLTVFNHAPCKVAARLSSNVAQSSPG
jgi:hypothetical protein